MKGWHGIGLSLVLASCFPSTGGQLRRLAELEVRVRPVDAGWYQLRSAEGYRFELPGIPDARPERYRLGREDIAAVSFELSSEMGSRGFRVRVFDARALAHDAREELRQLAEERAVRGWTVSDRRVRPDGVHELLLDGVSMNGHAALLRTFVRGGHVFQVVAVMAGGSGAPSDAARVVASVRADQGPASFAGRWAGEGEQTRSDPVPARWPMIVELRGTGPGPCGTVSYPTLRCFGEWICESMQDGTLRAREQITDGADRCVATGTMELRLISARELEWRYQSGHTRASARLRRE